jgi:hypothetical protein
LAQHGKDLLDEFASGANVSPKDIEPSLVMVRSGTRDSLLFRIATLWWSVPVSQGYGRRQRFLVKDRHNGKLLGIFALGDPVFNLSARDKRIGWTSDNRKVRLKYVVDAFVLGALPPYSTLLGGKLVAAIATSQEVEKAFCSKYAGHKTIIRNRRENAQLALLTTSSVFGQSSVYDRLRINDHVEFLYVGQTKGYGHFHVPREVFKAMVTLLAKFGHPYANGNRFGMGPNWKMRVIRVALSSLSLDPEQLRHGLRRGVYIAPLAENYDRFLKGEERFLSKGIQGNQDEITKHIKDRWIIPRAQRNIQWKTIDGAELLRSAINSTLVHDVL